MKSNKKLIIGNWKMYPNTLVEAKKIFATFRRQKHQTKNIVTVFCPPTAFLGELKKSYKGNKISLGAQNIFWEKEGAQTGETSIGMIKSLGARFVMVGHSERRALGENNKMVSRKVKLALDEDLHVILCIGEPERDDDGNHLKFLSEEIIESLHGVKKIDIKKLIIAYEPIWTIGKGKKAMTPDDLHMMMLYVRKILIGIYGRKIAEEIPIIYGGSANQDNAQDIIYGGGVDGLLIGRASLNPIEFSKIIDNVSKNKK